MDDVTLSLVAKGSDPEQLHAITSDLCNTLNRETDVEAHLPEKMAEAGAKGDPITIGTVVLAFLTTGAAAKLFDVFKSYFERDPKLEIELERKDGERLKIRAEDVGSDQVLKSLALAHEFLEAQRE